MIPVTERLKAELKSYDRHQNSGYFLGRGHKEGFFGSCNILSLDLCGGYHDMF